MNLNEFINEKIMLYTRIELSIDEDEIEKWIIDWYNTTFKEVGCSSPTGNSRQPPSWLADWRKHDK